MKTQSKTGALILTCFRMLIIIVFLLSFTKHASAQARSSNDRNEEAVDSLEQKNYLFAFPVLFRLPETRWGGGFASLFNFHINKKDKISPASQVQFGAAYTQNNQILLYLPFSLFWKERQHVAYGEVGYYRYSYNFFGAGDFGTNQAQNYDANFFRLRLNYLRELKNRWYIGGRIWYEDYEISSNEPGLIGEQIIRGDEGGRVLGFGLILNQDKRDNVFFPRKGHFIELVSHPDFTPISDFNFWRNRADFRLYSSLSKKVVWANQFFVDLVSGSPPFFSMAMLGGQRRMRGMFEGRYRDRNALLFQSELRADIYKRFGAVAFISAGNVAFQSSEFAVNKTVLAGGAGLRFVLDKEKHLNLRLDFAASRDHRDFYFTIGEAF